MSFPSVCFFKIHPPLSQLNTRPPVTHAAEVCHHEVPRRVAERAGGQAGIIRHRLPVRASDRPRVSGRWAWLGGRNGIDYDPQYCLSFIWDTTGIHQQLEPSDHLSHLFLFAVRLGGASASVGCTQERIL